MARIVIIGGGFGGLTAALLLARDSHQVTVLERDPHEPPEPAAAFDDWPRRGVPQFRLPHVFLPRIREIYDDELPDVSAALLAAGAHRSNRMIDLPAALTGGFRPGDERFEQITGRRAMVEAALAMIAAAEPTLEIRRGVIARALAPGAGRPGGVPHVAAVVLATGERVAADLVVDCSGRRSTVPAMLESMGATRPIEEFGDGGFVYYCRHFTGAAVPALLGAPLQHYEAASFVMLAGDNGTWSVGMMGNTEDTWMRRHATDPVTWTRMVRSYPLVAGWIDAEATTDVQVMARTPDRMTRYVVDGRAVATGIVAIGDAAASTSPAFGRGASFAAMEARCLRDVLREVSPADPSELCHRWHDRVGNIVYPFVTDTLAAARHRHAEIDAEIDGREYAPADPAWHFGRALGRAASHDPELLRAMASIGSALERGRTFAGRRDIVRRLEELGDLPGLPGPTRPELVADIRAERAA